MSERNTINVIVVVDTEFIKEEGLVPSQDPTNPTPIDHQHQFMIASQKYVESGQGTGDLIIKASPGDEVVFRGTSIGGNSEDAVIPYGIRPLPGQDNVFNQFVPILITRKHAVMPDNKTPNGLPPIKVQKTFASFESRVKQAGQESFLFDFAVYTLNNDKHTQDLYGYFTWDPGITVIDD